MSWPLYLPFLLQGIVMGLDEMLHLKRDLGKWERFGHPIDTLSLMLPLIFISLNDFSISRLKLYVGMSIFSCLLITKDEFIHRDVCSGLECWLHSLLFILHPLVLIAAGLLWRNFPESHFNMIQVSAVTFFFFYQIIRWSIPWRELQR